ncbi:MAG: CDP-alcohol phosphatidyltransferase family protein [Kiritimatiellae bacterium]|nr:CDP-alcohol phosphatidyltransferase family protein [Kiritimatiellia bacterium]
MERLELTERSRFVNMLTLARVPLIAAWMLFALAEERYGGFALGFFACAAMLLSGLTDLWDGWLARRWGVVSTFGKLADPLMDKIFYVVAFPTLLWLVTIRDGASFHSLLLLVFTILYILRDLWVTFMRAVGSVYGAPVAAMTLGKVRTALSFPAAGWIYLHVLLSPFASGAAATAWLFSVYFVEVSMTLLNVYSFFSYTRAYMPYVKKALEK